MRKTPHPAALVSVALFTLALAHPGQAELRLRWGPPDPQAAIPVDLPLVEAPYDQQADIDSPGMVRSLALASGAYSLTHGALAQLVDPWSSTRWKRFLGRGVVATADFITVLFPPYLAWQHEEWHRAVLSRRGMGSANDIYDFDLLATTVAVSHVRDEDLVRLKAEHPADQVRLSTAGIEGNYALAHDLEGQAFFADNPAFNQIAVALLYLSNISYLHTCASGEGDAITDESNITDGRDVPRRDFTGMDCVGWVYDLFRPDEPYAARGVHPSGVGIDRYRKLSQLRDDERGYLRRQFALSFLNLLDPYLVGLHGFELPRNEGPPLVFSFAVRHLPTSFGHVIRGDVFLRLGDLRAQALAQNYFNGQRWLPGLDLALLHYPLWQGGKGGWLGVEGSARLAGWMQPARQRYDEEDADAGGLFGLRLALRPHPRLAPYLELEAKSAGWVVGAVALERELTVRAGLVLRAF